MVDTVDNVVVFGMGYVGMANAIMLADNTNTTIIDIDKDKIDSVNKSQCFLDDKLMQERLSINVSSGKLNASLWNDDVVNNACMCVLAVPTNYDENTNMFDTSILDSLIKKISAVNPDSYIVIKSTIPVGYCDSVVMADKTKLIFMPEFLQEGSAMHDVLNPSRSIIGMYNDTINVVECSVLGPNIEFMSWKEAESVKMFSNAYLAMRVSFFNELDTFCIDSNINAKNVINGVTKDKRIGNKYCTPSMGYGGYCLVKDSKQLASTCEHLAMPLIKNISNSNEARKKFIARDIFNNTKSGDVIGFYRLQMKEGSDNCRNSSQIDVIKYLSEMLVEQGDNSRRILVYEPMYNSTGTDELSMTKFVITNVPDRFTAECSVIYTNGYDDGTVHDALGRNMNTRAFKVS